MKKIILISIVGVIIVSVIALFFIVFFPLKFKTSIVKYSERYDLNMSLVASVINVESGYKEDCVSRVGAMGLMQLMPKTADECARKLGLNIDEKQLFDCDINIELGCYYLKYLIDLYDGNIINALSAYNWGLSNVNNWLALGNVDNDGNITNLPVKETKNYLRKIKFSMFVYGKIYKLR